MNNPVNWLAVALTIICALLFIGAVVAISLVPTIAMIVFYGMAGLLGSTIVVCLLYGLYQLICDELEGR